MNRVSYSDRIEFYSYVVCRMLLCMYLFLITLFFHIGSPFLYVVIGGYLVYILFNFFKNTHYLLDLLIDLVFVSLVLHFITKWNWNTISFVFLFMLLIVDKNSKQMTYFYAFYSRPIKIIIMCFSMLLFVKDFSVINCILPFIFLCLFYIFLNYRYHISKLYYNDRKRISIFDDFIIEQKGKNSYVILKEVMQLLKKQPFGYEIKGIFCFRRENNSLYLVNGTKYVWNSRFLDPPEKINQIFENKKRFGKNILLELDGNQITKNIYFVQNDMNLNYSYLFVVLKDTSFKASIITQLILPNFFETMSKIVDFECSVKNQKRKELVDLKKKISYVDMATNTMHFIRNKLSPLTNYIALMNKYNKTSDKDEKDKIKPYVEKEFQNVKNSLDVILSHAEKMLEKSDNPINFAKTEFFGPQQLFSVIKSIWHNYSLDESNIRAEPIEKDEEDIKYYMSYNDEAFYLVLDNLIANLSQQENGIYGFSFMEKETEYTLYFYNNSKKKIKEDIVKCYNNNDKNEIIKNKYHGLYLIREYLDLMKINSRMDLQDNMLHFYINISKVIKYEESTNN